jgi:multidrug efflux pump subunit AcrB
MAARRRRSASSWRPDGNALETAAKAVKARMTELAKFFPKGVSWDVPYDTSRFVEISIREVVNTWPKPSCWCSW